MSDVTRHDGSGGMPDVTRHVGSGVCLMSRDMLVVSVCLMSQDMMLVAICLISRDMLLTPQLQGHVRGVRHPFLDPPPADGIPCRSGEFADWRGIVCIDAGWMVIPFSQKTPPPWGMSTNP